MKKLLPLLVVSILVLGGLGAVATTDDEKTATLGELEAEAKGGFGVTVTITNNGNMPHEQAGNVTIKIRCAPIMLLGGYSCLPIPLPIPAGGGSVNVSTGLVIGLGIGTVYITLDLDGDGVGDAEGSKNGVVLGPFVLCGAIPITIP